jgi:hypothetical protein
MAEQQQEQDLQEVSSESSPQKGSPFWHAYSDAGPVIAKSNAIILAATFGPLLPIMAANALNAPQPVKNITQAIADKTELARFGLILPATLMWTCAAVAFIPNYIKYKKEENAAQRNDETMAGQESSSFVQRESDKKRSSGVLSTAFERT